MRNMHAIELSELLVHFMSPLYYAVGYVCFMRTFSVPCGTTRHIYGSYFHFYFYFWTQIAKISKNRDSVAFIAVFFASETVQIFVVFKCVSHIIVVPLLRQIFSSRITPRWQFLIYLCPIQTAQLLESNIVIRSIFSSTWPLFDD